MSIWEANVLAERLHVQQLLRGEVHHPYRYYILLPVHVGSVCINDREYQLHKVSAREASDVGVGYKRVQPMLDGEVYSNIRVEFVL